MCILNYSVSLVLSAGDTTSQNTPTDVIFLQQACVGLGAIQSILLS